MSGPLELVVEAEVWAGEAGKGWGSVRRSWRSDGRFVPGGQKQSEHKRIITKGYKRISSGELNLHSVVERPGLKSSRRWVDGSQVRWLLQVRRGGKPRPRRHTHTQARTQHTQGRRETHSFICPHTFIFFYSHTIIWKFYKIISHTHTHTYTELYRKGLGFMFPAMCSSGCWLMSWCEPFPSFLQAPRWVRGCKLVFLLGSQKSPTFNCFPVVALFSVSLSALSGTWSYSNWLRFNITCFPL